MLCGITGLKTDVRVEYVLPEKQFACTGGFESGTTNVMSAAKTANACRSGSLPGCGLVPLWLKVFEMYVLPSGAPSSVGGFPGGIVGQPTTKHQSTTEIP